MHKSNIMVAFSSQYIFLALLKETRSPEHKSSESSNGGGAFSAGHEVPWQPPTCSFIPFCKLRNLYVPSYSALILSPHGGRHQICMLRKSIRNVFVMLK